MFYDLDKAVVKCEENPSLIFEVINEGYFEVIDKVLSRRKIDINTLDDAKNDILTRLLKAGEYDLVLKYMKRRTWNVNNQNIDGNTFAHFLVTKNYVQVVKIITELKKNKKFIPNIKNNKGETILDKSINNNNNYIYTTIKILEDKRFNNIDVMDFIKIYKKYIKNPNYGKYSKVTNLEIIVDNLDRKEALLPKMQELVELLKDNRELIKKEIMKNKSYNLEAIIESVMV